MIDFKSHKLYYIPYNEAVDTGKAAITTTKGAAQLSNERVIPLAFLVQGHARIHVALELV